LDLGFEWGNFDVIWASDISMAATESYNLNFGISPICSDISELSIAAIPNTDVIIGGPPCQSFSLAGKRRLDDPRGKLVFHFLEIIRQKLPRAFVMENVPGMISSKIDGRSLPDVLEEKFRELGYQVRQMRLNALDYLVPQRRRRLVLVGSTVRRPAPPDGREFAKTFYDINRIDFDRSAAAALGDLGPCAEKGKRSRYRDAMPSEFAALMRYNGGHDVSLHQCPRMSETDRLLVAHIPPGGNYMDIPDGISPSRVMKHKQAGSRTTAYGRLHPRRPSYTINANFRRPNVGCNFHYSEPRLITPREAMRLQSIPDHFELHYSHQDERNALIGNAVPPLMAQAIAWSVRRALKEER
jgi:DNA (cytosine-5)-methyltransferase 1